ncbi:MAG: PAS domain S-box protein [Acidobacteria bacterium]|nr:PAS domain S-box protein [Acidobacteriota bacterium]MCA1619921.1 PAS domain S-box protein [Acidobacteriota bacterium]
MIGRRVERGAGEGERSAAERFAYATLNALSEHVAVLDARGTILAVNRAWREFAGANSPAPAGLSEGANYFAAYAGATGEGAEYAARFAAGLRAVIEGESDEFTLEYPCHSPTQKRWYIARAKRFEFEGEAGAVVTHANVTARRLAEEERERLLHSLEAERSRLAYLFEHAPSFVAVLRGPRHVFEFANPPYLELIGGRDVSGKPVREALPEIEGQGYFEKLDEVLRTGRPHAGRGVRVLLRRESGREEEERFLDFVYQPMFDPDGGVSGVFVHGVDVTEHKRAEDRARASEERYRMLFTSIDEGFCVAEVLFDASGRGVDHRFIEVNPSFEKLTGVPVEAALSGRTVRELVPNIEAHWSEIYGRVLTTGEPERFVSGSEALGRWFDVYAFRAGRPEERKVAILFDDITERRRAEERLRESEGRLRSLFEASRDGILVEHCERAVYVNDSYARLFGYERPEELIGEYVSAVVAPEDAGRLLDYGRRRMRGEPAPTAYEFRGRRRDGTLLDLEASVSTHVVAGKTYITTAVRDISERKLAEEALRRSESKYRLLLEQASDGIHTYDVRGDIIETNSKLCEMLGYTREELLRLNVADLIPPEDLAAAPVRFDELQSGRTLLTERLLRRKDGTLLPVEISGRMIREGVLQSIIRDISERRRAEDALHEAYGELERRVEERTAELARAIETLKAENVERLRAEEAGRDLLGRLVTAQEEERRRISRELHDQMGQQLVALLLGLKTLGAESYGRRSSLDTLRQLEEITGELSREVHTLAWGLRPPALDDLGLEATLCNYAEEWAERSRVSVDFHSAGFAGGRLPLTHETAVYRIAQEALTNIAKHSGADHVSFILERRSDHVLAVIEDNGGGFDVEAAQPPAGRGGRLGLLGMRERAALLGGTINVESAPGAGTTVFVRIPFDAGGEKEGRSA